jgi:p21-activated kinase 1
MINYIPSTPSPSTDKLTTSKRPEISVPYDPVHMTHVGFDHSTREFTGLPKEWDQLLSENGISLEEQKRNPQAVMVCPIPTTLPFLIL